MASLLLHCTWLIALVCTRGLFCCRNTFWGCFLVILSSEWKFPGLLHSFTSLLSLTGTLTFHHEYQSLVTSRAQQFLPRVLSQSATFLHKTCRAHILVLMMGIIMVQSSQLNIRTLIKMNGKAHSSLNPKLVIFIIIISASSLGVHKKT